MNRGIEQIRSAANDMERSSQQVAAGSEETAAFAEDLSSQAVAMKQFVDDLALLIGVKAEHNKK